MRKLIHMTMTIIVFVLALSVNGKAAPTKWKEAKSMPAKIIATCQAGSKHTGFLEQNKQGLLVLHTYGTPYQRGFQHGYMLRSQIKSCFQRLYREAYFKLVPAPFWYGLARLSGCFLDRDEKDELRGLADGSGLSYSDVLVMNGHSPLDIINNVMRGGSVGCTQILARGSATKHGEFLLSRNLDTVNLGILPDYAVIQVQHPDDGPAYMTPGFAGKVLDAVTGVNEAGLYVSQNDGEIRWENCFGLYSGALVRRVLAKCLTVDQVGGMIKSTDRLSGGGKIIVVATTNNATAFEYSQNMLDGLLGRKQVRERGFGQFGDAADTMTVTNYFLCPPQAGHASASALARRMRAQKLVQRQLHRGIDSSTLEVIMTDKIGPDGNSYGPPDRPSSQIINWYGELVLTAGPFPLPVQNVRTCTTVSTVTDLSSRVMRVGIGQEYISSPDDYRQISIDRELWRMYP